MTMKKSGVPSALKGKLTILIAVALWLAVFPAQADDLERFNAFAVNMSNMGPSGATTVQIHITRWSSDEERTSLIETLQTKGHKDFVKALTHEKETGWFRFEGRMAARSAFPSTRLHFAHQYEQDGQRHIMLITNRPIGFREAASAQESVDYDVTAIKIEMPIKPDKDGKFVGKGTVYVALKVGLDRVKPILS